MTSTRDIQLTTVISCPGLIFSYQVGVLIVEGPWIGVYPQAIPPGRARESKTSTGAEEARSKGTLDFHGHWANCQAVRGVTNSVSEHSGRQMFVEGGKGKDTYCNLQHRNCSS